VSYVLPYSSLASVISDARDSEENEGLFRAAARHPSSDVREAVAYKDNLDTETLEVLSKDPSPSVVRNLVGRAAFKRWVSSERLFELVQADPDVAETVAQNIEAYDNVDLSELARVLLQIADPQVRYALAGNYSCPKSVTKSLTRDPDPQVRREAQERLK
jgi:hypothetical protein